jgi:hypothetical protein
VDVRDLIRQHEGQNFAHAGGRAEVVEGVGIGVLGGRP